MSYGVRMSVYVIFVSRRVWNKERAISNVIIIYLALHDTGVQAYEKALTYFITIGIYYRVLKDKYQKEITVFS